MISIVLPVYNEQKNIMTFVREILKVLSSNKIDGEIIIVDDGSTDNSLKEIKILAKRKRVRYYQNKVNMGKSFTLKKGFVHSKGDIILMIDADLQHSASDIPLFIKKIQEGYDVVNGWRYHRNDKKVKKVASKIYNYLTKKLFGLNIHDFNCGFKAFRKEVIQNLHLMSGEHRFIIPMARNAGYKISEIKVKHLPRKYGKSKYNHKRILSGIIDLITLKTRFILNNKPMKIFATMGGLLLIVGFILGLNLLYTRFILGLSLDEVIAIVILDTLLLLSGIQLFFFGFLFDSINQLKQEMNDKVFKK